MLVQNATVNARCAQTPPPVINVVMDSSLMDLQYVCSVMLIKLDAQVALLQLAATHALLALLLTLQAVPLVYLYCQAVSIVQTVQSV